MILYNYLERGFFFHLSHFLRLSVFGHEVGHEVLSVWFCWHQPIMSHFIKFLFGLWVVFLSNISSFQVFKILYDLN